MQEFTEIEAKIHLLSLSEQMVLRDQLDERIESMVELTADPSERLQIEAMQRRLADYEAGLITAEPWEVVEKRLRDRFQL